MGFTGVKVFSATKAREREELGENVTRWMRATPGVKVTDKIVTQSSDREFHCLTITLFYALVDPTPWPKIRGCRRCDSPPAVSRPANRAPIRRRRRAGEQVSGLGVPRAALRAHRRRAPPCGGSAAVAGRARGGPHHRHAWPPPPVRTDADRVRRPAGSDGRGAPHLPLCVAWASKCRLRGSLDARSARTSR